MMKLMADQWQIDECLLVCEAGDDSVVLTSYQVKQIVPHLAIEEIKALGKCHCISSGSFADSTQAASTVPHSLISSSNIGYAIIASGQGHTLSLILTGRVSKLLHTHRRTELSQRL